jgi:hypothetical protein
VAKRSLKTASVRAVSSSAVPTTDPVASSLPPTPDAGPSTPPTSPAHVQMARGSLKHQRALYILQARADGQTKEQIATTLGILPGSVSQYVYQAAQAGLLYTKHGSLLADPNDVLEYEVAGKALRNIEATLDGNAIQLPDGKVKPVDKTMGAMALEVAKGTLFKRFDAPKETALPSMNVLAIKIEIPSSGLVEARPGSMGGVGLYQDGEVINDGPVRPE